MNLTLDKQYFSSVASGKKTLTIRKGARAVTTGPAIFFSPDGETQMSVFITDGELVIYGDLTADHVRGEGFKSKAELNAALTKHYGRPKKADEMTVIHFTTSREEYYRSRRPVQKAPNRKISEHTEEGVNETILG